MALRIYDPRVLAIDLRFQRSGFAIYEGSRRLLDYGTTVVPFERVENSTNRFSDLLKISMPSVIVVKKERWKDMAAHPQAKRLTETLTREAGARGIEIRLLEQNALKATFRNLNCETKAEISASLSRFFPNLAWQLPPQRRIWDSEHPRQSVFDAIALGFAYWQRATSSTVNLDEETEDKEKTL
jgi:hypothetical protein